MALLSRTDSIEKWRAGASPAGRRALAAATTARAVPRRCAVARTNGESAVGCDRGGRAPHFKLRRFGLVWLAICAVWLSGGTDLSAQTAPSREYQVKAVFLFNFTQFVEWPPEAFPESQTPLVIGVLGEDPFGAYLDETVRDEKVNNRPLVVQRYRRVDEIKSCHVLFISRSETDRLEQILASLKGRNILTVGDADRFAQSGGMIRFVTEKGKIRLKINLEAAKAADLTISSKLLRPAEIVTPGKD